MYAIKSAFTRLFNHNHIYRDTRIVNWCPAMLTIVGDNDFEVKQLQGATEHYVSRLGEKIELGIYHYIAFTVLNPESDVSANLECQTINPELMPGVVALAILESTRFTANCNQNRKTRKKDAQVLTQQATEINKIFNSSEINNRQDKHGFLVKLTN